jgi:hypothetical protein
LAAIRTRKSVGAVAGEPFQRALGPIRWFHVWAWTAAFTAIVVVAITAVSLDYVVSYLDPGIDYDTLIGATRNHLAGNGFYPAYEVSGPWVYTLDQPPNGPPILYPPHALYLFVPFVFLPKLLWWAIPLSVFAWALWQLRPHPAAVLAILLVLGTPYAREDIFWGNPVMWMVAAEAAGFVLGWPAVLVLLKPSLGPFALAGFPRRSWFIALAVLSVANLPLLPMWADWIAVIRNAQLGPDFSLHQFPLMAVPLIAWLGSTRGPLIHRLERARAEQARATAASGASA